MPFPVKTVLLLGGTAEARALAGAVDHKNIRLVASLAGTTATPRAYPCETRIGGFGGVGGLRRYLQDEQVAALVDATHPFATVISANAAEASKAIGIPYLSFIRPPWPIDAHWQTFMTIEEAVAAMPKGARALATTGRKVLEPLIRRDDLAIFLRSVDPVEALPVHIRTITARGPFTVVSEGALMQAHGITHLLTRNAGGESRARLEAAGALGVTVHMIERPSPPAANRVQSVADALSWLDTVLRD